MHQHVGYVRTCVPEDLWWSCRRPVEPRRTFDPQLIEMTDNCLVREAPPPTPLSANGGSPEGRGALDSLSGRCSFLPSLENDK